MSNDSQNPVNGDQGTPAREHNPMWDDILFWGLVVTFGVLIPGSAYLWKPELLALALILAATLVAVSAVAYIVPMNAPKNVLNFKVIMVIYGALFAGIIVGSLPTFAQVMRFSFWDRVVPGGFTSVYPSDPSIKVDEATINADSVLTVTKTTPSPMTAGYLIQVRWFDAAGIAHYVLIEKGNTMKLPTGVKDADVRLMRGATVTDWVKAVPETIK